MHFSFRNQFHLPEGLRPIPGAKQTTKTTENQFNEDVMGPTPEVVETPAQFEYARGYGQMGYEQSTSQILPTEQIMSDENDTWPAATWVPKSQTENHFNLYATGFKWLQSTFAYDIIFAWHLNFYTWFTKNFIISGTKKDLIMD